MSKKDDLRTQREGTVINTRSKQQEKELDKALQRASDPVCFGRASTLIEQQQARIQRGVK